MTFFMAIVLHHYNYNHIFVAEEGTDYIFEDYYSVYFDYLYIDQSKYFIFHKSAHCL